MLFLKTNLCYRNPVPYKTDRKDNIHKQTLSSIILKRALLVARITFFVWKADLKHCPLRKKVNSLQLFHPRCIYVKVTLL